jgi:hypothetical protein
VTFASLAFYSLILTRMVTCLALPAEPAEGGQGGSVSNGLVAWPPNPHCPPNPPKAGNAGSAGKAANGRLLARRTRRRRARRVCIVPKGPANTSDGASLLGCIAFLHPEGYARQASRLYCISSLRFWSFRDQTNTSDGALFCPQA